MPIEKNELKSMLEEFKTGVENAITTKTSEFVEQSDATKKEVLELKEKLAAAEKALEEIKEQSKKTFGLPGAEQEHKNWSWPKFITGLYKNYLANKGEISVDSAKNYWDTTASLEHRLCKDFSEKYEKDFNASDGSSGGFLVPPEIYQGDIIDTVYANTAVMKMPCMRFENLRADMPIPVDEGNLSAYHVGETEAPTKTSSSFGLKWLRPKKIGAYTRISNRLLYETNNSIEGIVKGKLALDSAVELSRGLTVGVGADSEPKGILENYLSFTGTKIIALNGRRWTIDDIAAQKMALAKANELRDTNTYGTIMRPGILWAMLRERTEMYSGQASGKRQPQLMKLLLDKSVIENALKLKIEDTTQIPLSTVGTSTSCSKVITGDWSKFAVGTFGVPRFKISDQASDASGRSALLNDEVFLVMFIEYDCVCTRPTSFCGFDGAETSEENW